MLGRVWLFVTPWTACSPPGTSVHGIFQARILEWVAISYSRGTYVQSCKIRPLVMPSSSNWFLQSQKSRGSAQCTMNSFQLWFAIFLRISVVVYPEQNWPNLPLSICQIFLRNLGIVLENYIVKNKFLFFFFLLRPILEFNQEKLIRDFLIKAALIASALRSLMPWRTSSDRFIQNMQAC